jgi:hypothetical protein
MASTIRIKRSTVSGNPSTLAAGELAYSALTDNGSNGGDRLYIGIGTETAGNATNHYVIGGKYFTDMLDHTPGILTASSALIVDSNKKLDELRVDGITLNDVEISSSSTLKFNTASGIELNGSVNKFYSGPYGGSSLNLDSYDVILRQDRDGVISLKVGTGGSVTSTVTLNNDGSLTVPGTINTLSNNNLYLTPHGTGKVVISNAYIGDTSTSLAEYIYDTVGGAITAGTGITINNNDGADTSTVSITNTGVSANTYGSATAIPVITVNAQGQLTTVTTASVASNLNISGDTGTDAVALLSDTLSFVGGTGLTSAITNNTVTFDIDSTVATLTGSQTLTNKTLTLPIIGGTGAKFNGSSTGTITVLATATAGTNTLTLPAATDTLVGKATTDTLTNKTISGSDNTLSNIANSSLTNSSVTFGSTTVSLGNTSTTIAGITELTVDNLNFNGNTISSSDTNGNISLDPSGTGSVDVNGARITNLGTPSAGNDAVTRDYVDNAVTGLTWKQAANLLASSNVPLTGSTGTVSIDGHSALTQAHGDGYRLLLIGQLTPSDNGIYVYNDNGTTYTLTRPSDADTYDELIGMSIFIMEGSTYANTGWVQSNHYITSFSNQNWVQFSGAGAYTAGDGLGQSGTTFFVQTAADGGIEVATDYLQLKSSVAGTGLTLTSGVLDVVGTTNRITANADSIDIASTYVGQSSITTLGTITTGIWSGTTIGTTKGGTGLTSYALGDLLYSSAPNTLSTLAAGTEGKVLQMGGSGSPTWGDIDGGTY